MSVICADWPPMLCQSSCSCYKWPLFQRHLLKLLSHWFGPWLIWKGYPWIFQRNGNVLWPPRELRKYDFAATEVVAKVPSHPTRSMSAYEELSDTASFFFAQSPVGFFCSACNVLQCGAHLLQFTSIAWESFVISCGIVCLGSYIITKIT